MNRILKLALCFCLLGVSASAQPMLRIGAVPIVVPKEDAGERFVAEVLREEIAARIGADCSIVTDWPEDDIAFAIATDPRAIDAFMSLHPYTLDDSEGFHLYIDGNERKMVGIVAANARGLLYGVGQFLRTAKVIDGAFEIDAALNIESAPAYPIRGHQLGYRARANSWDAWTIDQFDQHIRDLAFFGINSIENIPFQDDRTASFMKYSREEMNKAMSEICAKYGLDYWIWTPAEFHLTDRDERAALLDRHEGLFRDCPELTGVFFPGGDPGENPPDLVLPYLEDLADILAKYHPDARVWLSLQWFNDAQQDEVYAYVEKEKPQWLGGFVAGPSSPPIPEVRDRLPKEYKYRLYPDITHNKLCQYPVPWWDQAYALTLGREAINPRPVQYAAIHNRFAPYSDGFISYSDGVHDDLNKAVWSARSWDPDVDVRHILIEYANAYFHVVDPRIVDGILALENNWQGPLRDNGAVEGTLRLWQELDREYPSLAGNWRWQMNLVRAYFDAYTRRRLIFEEEQERAFLGNLEYRTTHLVDPLLPIDMDRPVIAADIEFEPELRARIDELCAALFESIALQTSVPIYEASGAERGAFLDFIDYPLNNAWWYEDQMAQIRALDSDKAQRERLRTLVEWENPGPGSYYDDVGNIAQSPRVVKGVSNGLQRDPGPTHWWMDNGMSRARLSHQVSMDWPEAVVYEGVDPEATYVIRTTGYGKGLLRIDGDRVSPTLDGTELGAIKEFPVPAAATRDRKLIITWDRPMDEGHLNWRQQSRVCEIWLLNQR